MNPVLAIPIYLRQPATGVYAANTAAMDWFVIATLCFFFFLLGCFAMAAWQIWRRTTRPDPHIKLLMELADSDEENTLKKADEQMRPSSPQNQPWEKTSDWWKH